MVRKALAVTVALAALLLTLSCSEVNKQKAPVDLVGTVSQDLQVIDLGSATCGQIGTITLRSIVKRTDTTRLDFLDVRLSRMSVNYVRTDGGRTVPNGFVQSISGLVAANGSSDLNSFLVFEPDALVRAPFVALLPSNGGIDPETGRPLVKMDVILDIFGETLAGDNVATRVTFPLTFCVNCGGCR